MTVALIVRIWSMVKDQWPARPSGQWPVSIKWTLRSLHYEKQPMDIKVRISVYYPIVQTVQCQTRSIQFPKYPRLLFLSALIILK